MPVRIYPRFTFMTSCWPTVDPKDMQDWGMEAAYLQSWNAFTAELQKLRDELTKNASGKPPELLFRGQYDSAWPLSSVSQGIQ
jgi:hypothetical protein